MNKTMIPWAIGFLMAGILGVSSAGAATRSAANCSQSSVASAINAAAAGDTVVIPSGKCSWPGGIAIPNNKKITLQGAGKASTVIACNGTVLDLGLSGSRVTGIGFVNGNINVDGDNWRIDHCDFNNSSWRDTISVVGSRPDSHPKGLIDHCSFYNGRVAITGYSGATVGNAHQLWTQPLALGTDYAVFVEDCTFVGNPNDSNSLNAIDMNYGGRYVFRHNTVAYQYLEIHSLQQGRGSRSWEIYNNTLSGGHQSWRMAIRPRGGSGVIFNNIFSGTWGGVASASIYVDNVRSCADGWDGGVCSGSSNYDGNTAGQQGYPCRDQIGRSYDTVQWSPGGAYTQTRAPAYEWGNVYNPGGSKVTWQIAGNCSREGAYHIKLNRDIFSPASGPSLPVGSCSQYQGFFQTSNNTLYQCNASGQWVGYYTPYTYPHPLQNGGGDDMQPPQNFHFLN